MAKQSAFDPEKDELLTAVQIEADRGAIEIKVCSYRWGEPKVQVSRFTDRPTGRRYGKLGRFTLPEAEEIAEALMELVANLRGKTAKEIAEAGRKGAR